MTTLSDVRGRVRKDLSDAGSLVWPDDQLDRHIEHALSELSLAMPRELATTVSTTDGSRDIAIDGLAGLIEVETAEYPLEQFPPAFIGFSVWGSVLSLHSPAEPDGDDAKLYYTAVHVLDDVGTTLNDAHIDILVTGATAYAAQELASATANQLNLEPGASERYAAWSRARLTAFRQLLHTYGRKNRLRGRRMYVPA
jgi:hypothetical protein